MKTLKKAVATMIALSLFGSVGTAMAADSASHGFSKSRYGSEARIEKMMNQKRDIHSVRDDLAVSELEELIRQENKGK